MQSLYDNIPAVDQVINRYRKIGWFSFFLNFAHFVVPVLKKVALCSAVIKYFQILTDQENEPMFENAPGESGNGASTPQHNLDKSLVDTVINCLIA